MSVPSRRLFFRVLVAGALGLAIGNPGRGDDLPIPPDHREGQLVWTLMFDSGRTEIRRQRFPEIHANSEALRGVDDTERPSSIRLAIRMETVTGSMLREFRTVQELETISVTGGSIRDDALLELAGLSSLRCLILEGCQVSRNALKGLAELQKLEELILAGTPFTDDAVPGLSRLNALRILDLRGSSISDRELQQLSQLRRLTLLDVRGTSVSAGAARRLQAAVPGLRVLSGQGRSSQEMLAVTDIPEPDRQDTVRRKGTFRSRLRFRHDNTASVDF